VIPPSKLGDPILARSVQGGEMVVPPGLGTRSEVLDAMALAIAAE
jgi:hypothetical protein